MASSLIDTYKDYTTSSVVFSFMDYDHGGVISRRIPVIWDEDGNIYFHVNVDVDFGRRLYEDDGIYDATIITDTGVIIEGRIDWVGESQCNDDMLAKAQDELSVHKNDNIAFMKLRPRMVTRRYVDSEGRDVIMYARPTTYRIISANDGATIDRGRR